MLHLICLRCSHANAADAKFCGACGAALLRKFCADCHAVNDAESHFCCSCGAGLPVQPAAPAAAATEPVPTVSAATAAAPSTIGVADADRPVVRIVTPTPLPMSSIVELPPRWLSTPPQTSLFASKPHALAYRPSLLLGFTGAAAALLVFASWPRFDHARAPSETPSAPTTTNHATAAVNAAPVSLAPAAAIAGVPVPSMAAAPTGVERTRGEPAASRPPIAAALAVMPKPAGGKPMERRATPDALLASQPPAAGPRAQPERTSPTRRSLPVSAPECTPQVDALGLCEPGAKVNGR